MQPKLLLEAFLFVANFAAPSLMKSDVTACTLKMIGSMISSTSASSSCGILLCPIFTYKVGQPLFQDDFGLCKEISSTSCQVDTLFQLVFDVKSKTEAW